jgi:hypothetical protein
MEAFRLSAPITALSSMMAAVRSPTKGSAWPFRARSSVGLTSRASPTACPASGTACRSCGRPASGRLTSNQFVALTSTNAARVFGLYPRKGTLQPGCDADLVIWDPDRHVTYGVARAHHRTDYNLYEGWELKGFPEKVYLRGNLIVDGDRWLGWPGMGRFLSREPFAPVL